MTLADRVLYWILPKLVDPKPPAWIAENQNEKMNTLALREKLVAIAKKDVGQMETSRNRGPAIAKFWPATSYPEGYANREPYCAAGVVYWVREWLRDPEVLAALKITTTSAESWRCKSARAFDWQDWGKSKGLLIMNDGQANVLHTGDIMVFDMSHIGIVTDDFDSHVRTIEANTGATGGRDGDGIFEKVRARSLAKCFIRIMP